MTDDGTTAPRRRFAVQEPLPDGDPYPQYAWFREHDPVHIGDPGWPIGRPQVVVFRYADVMQGLKDPRMIRQFTKLPEVHVFRKLQRWEPPGPETFDAVSRRYMLFQDPPEHTRLRRLAARAFTAQFVADQRDEIEHLASELLSRFRAEQGGEGDLIQALASPLPMLVTARILGIPREDIDLIRDWSMVIGATIDTPTDSLSTMKARIDGLTADLLAYLRSMVRARSRSPKDDVVSRMIASRDDDGDHLSEDELVTMCMLLVSAGHQTMVNVVANGTLALMRHRDQWDLLVANPSLVGNAVEEIIRYDSPTQFTGRIAGEDVEIGGVAVPRGSEVLFMLGSANRDATVWDEPDRLRIDRKIGRHAGFGAGAHSCMGAPLARLQASTVFRVLAREAPGMTLANPAPTWRSILHGLERLDVRL